MLALGQRKFPFLGKPQLSHFWGIGDCPVSLTMATLTNESIELGVCLVSEIRSITIVAESRWYVALEQ